VADPTPEALRCEKRYANNKREVHRCRREAGHGGRHVCAVAEWIDACPACNDSGHTCSRCGAPGDGCPACDNHVPASGQSVFQVVSAEPAMTRCSSPEDRAGEITKRMLEDSSVDIYAYEALVAKEIREAQCDARLAALREAEGPVEALREAVIHATREAESARSKAFEEAAKLCEAASDEAGAKTIECRRKGDNERAESFLERSWAYGWAAEKIRARAKEAPRGS
jgi:hypothetical protein